MSEHVPRKNIDPVMVDVKNPGVNYSWSVRHAIVNLRRATVGEVESGRRVRTFIKRGAIVCAVLFLGLVVYTSYDIYSTKDALQSAGAKVAGNFTRSVNSLQSFDPENAQSSLKENAKDLKQLDLILSESHATNFFSALGSIIPAFKEAGSLIQHVTSLNMQFLALTENLSLLKQDGFKYFQSNGEALLSLLRGTQASLNSILEEVQAVKNTTGNLKNMTSFFDSMDREMGEKYLAHSAELYQLHGVLGKFIDLIGSNEEKHILVLFQNPSEIRPGGGFIGSYANISVSKGQMTNLEVRDIYDPDGQFLGKVIPPEPLRTLTENWGARDANWFFDFPTSAKTVVGFLEKSRIYSDTNTTFDAAIAVNIHVVESLLDITGPIELPEYKLTISSENFLREVQREVEAGNDKKKGQPKTILKKLTPLLLEKLNKLSAGEQKNLIESLSAHVAKKDIMVYAKDPEIASFLHGADADGSVLDLPRNFWGTYLAVVNANVAGGKTDEFIDQAIEANINIDTGGSLLTDLLVRRTHRGGSEKDPWWNAENKDYMQVLVNPGSNLISVKGNSVKTAKSSFNYAAGGYEANLDLQKIESTKVFSSEWDAWTFDAFGKGGFATWLFVPPKTTKEVQFRYHTENALGAAPATGTNYIFYFERQSGVHTTLRVTVNAPLGFVWKSTKTPVLTYENADPDGRVSFSEELERMTNSQ